MLKQNDKVYNYILCLNLGNSFLVILAYFFCQKYTIKLILG